MLTLVAQITRPPFHHTLLGGPRGVTPQVLRELGVYGGAQGVWIDKARTIRVAPTGVTMGLLHTGSSYADDLSTDGVIYHFPRTDRAGDRDLSEIRAVPHLVWRRAP